MTARARSLPLVLTPCPPLHDVEKGNSGLPFRPPSPHMRRGGQGVRTERAQRARAKDLLAGASRMRGPRARGTCCGAALTKSRSFAPAALRMTCSLAFVGPHPLFPSPRCGEGELGTALSSPLSAYAERGTGGEDRARGTRACEGSAVLRRRNVGRPPARTWYNLRASRCPPPPNSCEPYPSIAPPQPRGPSPQSGNTRE